MVERGEDKEDKIDRKPIRVSLYHTYIYIYMNIIQSCIRSMKGFDLMDITLLFLVCMGNMLLLWQV